MRATCVLLASLFATPPVAAERRPEAAPTAPATIAAEVSRRFSAGVESVPVLVLFRPANGGDGRALAAPADLPAGFRVGRRLSRARVVSGLLTREGAAALLARGDVAAVSLDAEVRPAGQIGTAQIGADLFAASGLTGTGRTIAILDTGVDSAHVDFTTELGASRVLPGWNAEDGTDDVTDRCGHGTAVAGVAAGAAGVAPGARILPIKVFPTAACGGGRLSNVLAGIEWALDRREETGLAAINLSLTDDRFRPGFCDADDPASSAVFAAARAAGVVVLAASGNDGSVGALPWPACFRDVASVGMVHSSSAGPVSWGGTASCLDATTGPDVVPCASNSGRALSLLAPGVNWQSPAAGGGRTATFSGTSAAAPAAAGAVALLSQARPYRDPATVLDLVRATGAAVADPKAGTAAPRLDLNAAMSAADGTTGACPATGIPDGSATGLTCLANVSSLATDVAHVVVALTIDHPDPRELVVTLRSPDGTSAVLMNRSGRPGEAVRAVFGRTDDPVQPLSAFAGHAASGLWRLEVLDTIPGRAGTLHSFSLHLEPERPETGEPAQRTLVVPSVARSAGKRGSFFRTNLRLFNTDTVSTRTAVVSYAPADGSAPATRVAIALPPGGTRVLDDVVGNVFRTSGFGPLALDLPREVVAAAATTSPATAGGSYGVQSTPVEPTQSAGMGTASLHLVTPVRAGKARVNAGFVETSGRAARAELGIYDRHGARKGLLARDVEPYRSVQMNDVYAGAGAAAEEGDRFEVRVVAGSGRVSAWATAIDDVTNDATWLSAQTPVVDALIPAAARAPGRFGSFFVTDLAIYNPSPAPVQIRVDFAPTSGANQAPLLLTVGGDETRFLPDVLSALWPGVGEASGALRLSALDGGAFIASSATFTEASGGGRYGLAIDPQPSLGRADVGRRLALTLLGAGPDVRTNLGLVELDGRDTAVRVTLRAPDGSTLGDATVTVPARSALQWNDVFLFVNASAAPDASALVEVLSGGAVAAHAIRIDNRTNDAIFLPARLVR